MITIKDLDFDIKLIKETHPKTNIKLLSTINEVLYSMYRDKYEITISNINDIKIYIYFPIIEISNKNNKNHTIYNMIVGIFIQDNKITNIKGARNAFTLKEIYSNYVHSHLGITPTDQFCFDYRNSSSQIEDSMNNITTSSTYFLNDYGGSFCLGNGGINKVILLINSSKKVEKNMWILFFRNIKTYLEYESLEGGPYRRIEEISYRKAGGITLEQIESGYYVKNAISFFYEKKELKNIYDDISNNVDTYNFIIDENGNLSHNYSLIHENLLAFDIVSKTTAFSKNGLKKLILKRKIENNKPLYMNNDTYSFDKSYKEIFDNLEKNYITIGNSKAYYQLVDKQNLSSEFVNEESVLHPILTKKILENYASYQSRKKSIAEYSQGRKKSAVVDF